MRWEGNVFCRALIGELVHYDPSCRGGLLMAKCHSRRVLHYVLRVLLWWMLALVSVVCTFNVKTFNCEKKYAHDVGTTVKSMPLALCTELWAIVLSSRACLCSRNVVMCYQLYQVSCSRCFRLLRTKHWVGLFRDHSVSFLCFEMLVRVPLVLRYLCEYSHVWGHCMRYEVTISLLAVVLSSRRKLTM